MKTIARSEDPMVIGRILIIELTLTGLQINALVIHEGDTALQAARNAGPFDAALIDVVLPGEYADDIDRVTYQFWNDSLKADVDSDELIEQAAEQFRTILENITIGVTAANEAEERLRQQCETDNIGNAATAHC